MAKQGGPKGDQSNDEDRFRALSEAAFEGILIVIDGHIVEANQRAVELFGFPSVDQIIGRSPVEFIVPEDQERTLEAIRQNRQFFIEVKLRRTDGSVVQAEAQGRPFTYKGRAARVTILRDITERVKAQEALRASEERYRGLAETAVDAIITSDDIGVILDWNQGAEKIFGYPKEEAIGLPLSVIMPHRYVAAHDEGMERVKRTGETRVIGRTVELHGLRRTGEEFPLELSISRWYSEGRVWYTGIIRDITKRKQNEEQVRRQSLYVQLLQKVAVASNEATSIESAMQFAVDEVCRFTGWPIGHVYLSKREGDSVELVSASIWHAEDRPGTEAFKRGTESVRFMSGSGLPGRAHATARPVWIADLRQEPNYPRAKIARDVGVKAGFAFPILVRREVMAVMEFFSDQTISPDEDLLEAMFHIGAQLGRVVERKQAEEALLESEMRYRLLAENATDLITRHNPEGISLYVSPASRQLLGYAPDELLGCNLYDFFLPEDLERMAAEHQHVLDQQTPRVATFRVRKKDGTYTWFESTSQAVRGETGDVLEFITVSRDISDRKAAEQALRSSEELISSVVRGSSDAISAFRAVRNARGAIQDFEWLLANPKAIALSRTGAEDLAGLQVLRDAPDSPDTQLIEVYKEVVESGALYEDTVAFTVGNVHQWLHVTAVKLGDGCAVTLRDVTERIEARQAVEQANEALATSNRELQEFAYVASHDLQEPLRKISSFADLLRADFGDRLNEEGIHYLERMQSAAVRMSRLISDLLAFSRVATHGQTFSTVDLNGVLKDVLTDVELLVQESGGEVQADELPRIQADRTQMRQLFQNLISNALKFRKPEQAPVVQVRATLESNEGIKGQYHELCKIEVEDNGIGFDQKYTDRIFMPFQRLHSEAQYPGTGIGLAVCRRIAERHGGSISVQSTPGKGTTFTILLPVRQKEAASGT